MAKRHETPDPGFLELGDEELRELALGNWVQLNRMLRRAAPGLVHRLLALEARGRAPRSQILLRLYGRLSQLRATRERLALLQAVSDQSGDTVRAVEGVIRDLSPQGRSGW